MLEVDARHDVRPLHAAEQVPVLSVCCTFSGKPLCRLIAADTVQPPRIQSAALLLLPHLLARAERQLDTSAR